MTHASSLAYIETGMLTTLPSYSFKSYLANTKLYLIITYRHAVCLKTFSFLNEGNSRYAFKQYTTMMLQLHMLL